VAWSLEVEVQFYLLAPFLCCVFLIGNKWIRRSLIVAGILIFSYFFGTREYHIFLLGEIQYFLAGLLLADVFLVEWKKVPASGKWFDLVGIIVLAVMWFVVTNRFYIKPLLPFLILIAYIAAFRGVFWNRLTRNRWLVVIGGMCYTIYLYHFQFIALLARTTANLRIGQSYALNCFLQIALVVPLVVIASAFLFASLERPFMVRNWPSKLVKNIKAVFAFSGLSAKGG
jgi:peptidoglycan/LPS O-acetylase OafA/YrhL